ncbi:MAG: hypothetical protein OIF57_17255 [Marinobacterium sp.]|nr:hypothetical protein [Marinobacterium sp.]
MKLLSSRDIRLKSYPGKHLVNELSDHPALHLKTEYADSPTSPCYNQNDIKAVAALELDLIFKATTTPLYEELLKTTHDGAVYLQYGDDYADNSHPVGFWEVLQRRDTTGFSIQWQPPGASPRPLLRGNLPTKRTFTQNQANLYNEAAPYIAKTIIDYATTSEIPELEAAQPFSNRSQQSVSALSLVSYTTKTAIYFAKLAFDKLVLKKQERWSVVYQRASWNNIDLSKGLTIKNPPGHFYADPFICHHNDRDIIFVEDYDYSKGFACIAAVEIINDDEYRILGPVIEEPYHMSFPFILHHEGELYMIPEVSKSNAIRLYKCIDYPMKWEYQKDLISNIRAADTMIFQHDEKWWLLSNIAGPDSNDFNSTLSAYYSDSPLSDSWTAHPANPLVFDSNTARNAGIHIQDGRIIRSRQKQGFDCYGEALSLAEIKQLDNQHFREQTLCTLKPDFQPGLAGWHHMHSNGKHVVYDCLKKEKTSH